MDLQDLFLEKSKLEAELNYINEEIDNFNHNFRAKHNLIASYLERKGFEKNRYDGYVKELDGVCVIVEINKYLIESYGDIHTHYTFENCDDFWKAIQSLRYIERHVEVTVDAKQNGILKKVVCSDEEDITESDVLCSDIADVPYKPNYTIAKTAKQDEYI
jgi:hypothetical protein